MRAEAEEIMRNQEKYFAGFHEGEAKGEAKAKAEVAKTKAEAEQKLKETQTLIVKKLLNENMTDLKIMEITNITKEELGNIKKELN